MFVTLTGGFELMAVIPGTPKSDVSDLGQL
jgi:hypothetical protein